MTDKPQRYLGDGVYASFDGYQIWLDTRAQEPVNRIALEPEVFRALCAFERDLRAGAPPGGCNPPV
jgi:hypothetical protein